MSSRVFYFEDSEQKPRPKLISQGTQIDPYDFKPKSPIPSFEQPNRITHKKLNRTSHSYIDSLQNNHKKLTTSRSYSSTTHKSSSNISAYIYSKEEDPIFKNSMLNKVFKRYNIHKTKITRSNLYVDIHNVKIFNNQKPHNTISLKKANSPLYLKVMNGAKKEKSSHVDNIKKEYNNTKRLFRSQIKKVVCIDGENINQEMFRAHPIEEENKSSLSKGFHGMYYKGNSFKVRNLVNLRSRNIENSYNLPYSKSLPLL